MRTFEIRTGKCFVGFLYRQHHLILALHKTWRFSYHHLKNKLANRLYVGPIEIQWSWKETP